MIATILYVLLCIVVSVLVFGAILNLLGMLD